MALITCPECSKSISDEAAACPSCGYPIKPPPLPRPAKKTGLWWGIGCLIAIPALMTVVAIVGLLAAIAIPSFVKARTTSQLNACINNMRMIDAAKEQAGLEHGYRVGDAVPESEVSPYLRGGLKGTVCPAGGRYTLNPLGEDPVCSKHGSLSEADASRRGGYQPPRQD